MPHLYKLVVLTSFLSFISNLAFTQVFRGEVNYFFYDLDIKDRNQFTNDKGSIYIDSSKVNRVGNFKICGDTLISTSVDQNGELRSKSINFGGDVYIKRSKKPGYFRFKMAHNDVMGKAQEADWKRTKGKFKKDGFEWYLDHPNKPDRKFLVDVDTTQKYPNQFAIGGAFSQIFHHNGLKTMFGMRYRNKYHIRWFEYQINEDLVCKDFMNDFWVDKKAEIDLDKELLAAQTSKVITPKADRQELPPAEFQDNFGEPVFLDQFLGKYVYIDFWASWCAPCRAEMPYTKIIRDKYRKKDLEVLSVTLDKEAALEQWQTQVEKLEMDWHNWHLRYDFGSSLATEQKIKGIPRYILLDPEGKIVNDNAPRPSDPELINFLDKILSKKRD